MKRFSKFLMAGLLMAALILAGCNNVISTQIGQSGTIKGKAVYSNGDTNAGINITMEKLVGGRSVALDDENAIAYQTVTGADGTYEIDGIEPGVYTIYAKSAASVEGAAAREVEVRAGDTVTVADLNLTAVGSIKGKALHSNYGEQGLLVYIAGTSYSAKTDAYGNYEITGVPAGKEYILVAETANGVCVTIAEKAVTVEANKAVEAETLVVWGTDNIKHVSASAVEGGILFNVSVPSYASNAGTTMSLNVTDSSTGSGTQYTWNMTSGSLSHSFVYPFVEKGKWYTFTVWYGDYSYRVFEERISVLATDGWGEATVTNADKVNLHIEKNEEDSIVIKLDQAPELADIGQEYTLSNSYQIHTNNDDGGYASWLYGPAYSIADERAMEFDIFAGATYIDGSYGGWRDSGYMKGFMWGHNFGVDFSARITLPNCLGYYTIPVSSVTGTAKGKPVEVTVDYSKGIAFGNKNDFYVEEFEELLKEYEPAEDKELTDEEKAEYAKRKAAVEKAINDLKKTLPANQKINYGDMVAEPTVTPVFETSYTYKDKNDNGEEVDKTMYSHFAFVGWVDSNGNKISFVNAICPTDRKDFSVTDSKPLTEYKIYPAFAEKNIRMTFNTDGGSFIPGRYVAYGERLYPETPSKEGFKFGGWYLDAKFEKSFDNYVWPEDYYSEKGVFEMTLYAKWIPEYKVTFVTNGGSELKEMIAYKDEPFTPPTPTQKDYAFDGWYLDDKYTTPFTGVVDKDTTLYAKWVKFADIVDQILISNGDAKGKFTLGDGWFGYNAPDVVVDKPYDEPNVPESIRGGYCLRCSPEKTYDYKSVTLTVKDCSSISFSIISTRLNNGYGYLNFYIDDNRQNDWGPWYSSWSTYSYNVPFGEHTFRWEFYKEYGDAYALVNNIEIYGDKFEATVGCSDEILNQIVSCDGDAKPFGVSFDKWGATKKDYYNGEYSLNTKLDGLEYTTATFSLKVEDCSSISFASKVQRDYGYGYLEFYIDEEYYISPDTSWWDITSNSNLPYGEHTFTWKFRKDYGNVCAWIDNIVIGGEKPALEDVTVEFNITADQQNDAIKATSKNLNFIMNKQVSRNSA